MKIEVYCQNKTYIVNGCYTRKNTIFLYQPAKIDDIVFAPNTNIITYKNGAIKKGTLYEDSCFMIDIRPIFNLQNFHCVTVGYDKGQKINFNINGNIILSKKLLNEMKKDFVL